jgi:hypothetical protein
VYGAINVAGLVSSSLATALERILGAQVVVAGGAGLELVAAVLAIALAVGIWLRPPEGVEGPGSLQPLVLALAGGAVVFGGGASAAAWTGLEFSFTNLSATDYDLGSVLMLNPAGVLAATVLAGGALGVAALAGRSVPPLFLAGVGLVLAGLALLPSALPASGGMLGVAGAQFVGGLGEPLVYRGDRGGRGRGRALARSARVLRVPVRLPVRSPLDHPGGVCPRRAWTAWAGCARPRAASPPSSAGWSSCWRRSRPPGSGLPSAGMAPNRRRSRAAPTPTASTTRRGAGAELACGAWPPPR